MGVEILEIEVTRITPSRVNSVGRALSCGSRLGFFELELLAEKVEATTSLLCKLLNCKRPREVSEERKAKAKSALGALGAI
jgi:hypothetical protein